MKISIELGATATPRELHLLKSLVTFYSTSEVPAGVGAGVALGLARIAPEDNPATGTPSAIDVQADNAAAIFGGQQSQPVHEVAAPLEGAPAVPAVPSPTISDASPLTPAGAPERDVRGLPWDARIHSGTKAVNADGTWRQRRGLNDPALVKRVEAELQQIVSAPAPAAVVPPPPTVAELQQSMAAPAPAVVPPPPQPTITMAAAQAGIPQPPATAAPELTFAALMQEATKHIAAQKLTREELDGCAMAAGLPTLVSAVQRPDLLPAIQREMHAIVASKG
jgi:hypothetical protein